MRMPFVWHEGYPLIEGAVGWLTCRVVKAHLSGDHTLYIGQVESLGCSDRGAPLVFYAGEYQSLEVQAETHDNILLYEPSWATGQEPCVFYLLLLFLKCMLIHDPSSRKSHSILN